MKNKIRTQYNYNPADGKEKGGGISLTVPDQTLSLQTILERFTRGQSVATLTPVWDVSDELPDFNTMDKVEIEGYKNNLKTSLKKAKEQKAPASAQAPARLPEQIEGIKTGEQ